MSKQDHAGASPLRIFIFDSTRLRSHLFFRFISTSPQVAPIYHPFLMAGMFGPEQVSQHFRHSEMRRKELQEDLKPFQADDTYESNRQKFAQGVSEVEKRGKIVVSNEHWFNVVKTDLVVDFIRGKVREPAELGRNPTYLPDDIFDTLSPVVLIRHPALSVNSIYRDALKMTKQRPGDEDFDEITSNKFSRILFDYFKDRGRQPVVVDGEDILWRTEDMSKNLCAALGLDPSGLSDSWIPTSQDEIDRMNPRIYMLTKNIHDSSGIERPSEKPAEPNLDTSFREWTEKYGSTVAEQLRAIAENNMPHYEYLKQFKV